MIKHTEGPWKLDIWDYSNALPRYKEIAIQNKDFRIARLDADMVGDNPYTIPKEEAMGNARIMAAAPDMIKALREIASGDSFVNESKDEMLSRLEQIAKEAIARVYK